MTFEEWVFDVNFGDTQLYLKHRSYMKMAYEARDEEIKKLQDKLEQAMEWGDQLAGKIKLIEAQ